MGPATLRLGTLLVCFLACYSMVSAVDPLSPGPHQDLSRQQRDRRGSDRDARMVQGEYDPSLDA